MEITREVTKENTVLIAGNLREDGQIARADYLELMQEEINRNSKITSELFILHTDLKQLSANLRDILVKII